ncbi:unnamed protein product [Cylicocyclus nassatus]|uniref:Uncharacterized protein n=1 Tax=Cylicocyclus nassatus TaxID=53992 RepID=A0AA36MBE6_CYLNA|nr:unnamed protein product [Cylicocyclus nassatus]
MSKENDTIKGDSHVAPPKVKPDEKVAVNAAEKVGEEAEGKIKFLCWKLHKKTRFRKQLLPMEPLCCLSSAIIREGAGSAAFLEFCGALITTAVIYLHVWKKHFELWAPLPRHSIKEFFLHPAFYHIICVHNAILALSILFLALALCTFSKSLMTIKYYYCHVSLILHLLALLFSLYVLCTPGTIKWTYTAAALVFCFSAQIVLELWAIAVIGACKDFFKMVDTFSSMAGV